MAQTQIRGTQVEDGTIQRRDLNTTTAGQAVAAKIIQGTNITLSSTGADSGTGDVTISCPTVGQGPFLSKTAAYTLLSSDAGKYIICSGGSWTLTLPAPATGLYFQVRNDMGISGTTGTITLQPTSGTIDGLASVPLLPQQECTVITDGVNWRTFGLKREVILGTQDIATPTASGSVLLPTGFRFFELNFTNFQPVTDGNYLIGNFSLDGGATWLTTNYFCTIIYNSSATAATVAWINNDTYVRLSSPGWSSAQYTQSRVIINPGASNPTWLTDSGGYSSTAAADVHWLIHGYMQAGTGKATALKFLSSAGNIQNLSLTVKGVV